MDLGSSIIICILISGTYSILFFQDLRKIIECGAIVLPHQINVKLWIFCSTELHFRTHMLMQLHKPKNTSGPPTILGPRCQEDQDVMIYINFYLIISSSASLSCFSKSWQLILMVVRSKKIKKLLS